MRRKIFSILIILFISYNLAFAQDIRSKDWVWNIDSDEFYYAITLNDVEHLLGQYCYFNSGSCVYVLRNEMTCEEDHDYPALINSDAGALSVRLYCVSESDAEGGIFAIKDFDNIDLLIREASSMRIAVPIGNDMFKVSRFSLSGSVNAIEKMRTEALKLIDKIPARKATSDEEYL